MGVAAVGTVAFLLLKLSQVVEDILKNSEFNDLDAKWDSVKKTYRSQLKIPRQNKDEIADWARRRLSSEGAKAVIAALEKSTSGSRSTARVKGLTSTDIRELLESLISLVAADFTVFEILIGAVKETDNPGRAVRNIVSQMDSHAQKLRRDLGQ